MTLGINDTQVNNDIPLCCYSEHHSLFIVVAECLFGGCIYAEYHYAEFRGAL
jgi:hypothetical protein